VVLGGGCFLMSEVPLYQGAPESNPPPATRSELSARFGPLLKSPWEGKFQLDLHGEIDVCENRDIVLFWWLVPPLVLTRKSARP
jgi:hypothetical protein